LPPPEMPLQQCVPRVCAADDAPEAPAARGDWLLYVVDRRQRRVDAYTDDSRRLRHRFGAGMEWQPCDVAACGDTAFILDETQAVYRHNGGREALKLLLRDAARTWSRIVCDGAGGFYLYAPGAASAQRFHGNGRARGERRYGA